MSHNDFSEKSRNLFIDAKKCWHCGSNRVDCLHHIQGRGNKGDDIESSPLNAAPLCNQKCHLPFHGKHRTEEGIKILINKTYDYLKEIGYSLSEKDSKFIERYIKHYQ